MRVVLPRNADAFIGLIDLIVEKEEALAPNGKMSAAELTELKGYRAIALAAAKESDSLKRKSEEKTAERDRALGRAADQGVDTPGTCAFLVTMLRDRLLADNKTNPKVLGEWGFTVNDSPAPKKKGSTKPAA